MTSRTNEIDLGDLRQKWAERRRTLQQVLRRIDTRGMSRPARDPEERAWLQEQGGSYFREDEEMGAAARDYYSRKYSK